MHNCFTVSKNKPPPEPFGGSISAARASGTPGATKQITSRHRTVVNFKPGLNKILRSQAYRVGSARKARLMVRAGDFMVTLDLESMYFNLALATHTVATTAVDVSWSERLSALCKLAGSRLAAFAVNAFGVTSAGFPATVMLNKSLSLTKPFVRSHDLMDDVLLAASTFESAMRAAATVVTTLAAMGWRVSATKSVLIPSQLVQRYGGFKFDTLRNLILVPPDKMAAYKLEWRAALASWKAGARCTLRYLARIVGQINSMSLALFYTRAFLDPLIEKLSSAQRAGLAWSDATTPDDQMISALETWTSPSFGK